MSSDAESDIQSPPPPPAIQQNATQSFPPSHILQDGRFIYLPDATNHERSVFLQRSIHRHNLLNDAPTEEEAAAPKKEEATEPIIHPLAVASARLQANGIAELSKAINLSGLVNTGEYFGLSNIVNQSLVDAKDSATGNNQPALALGELEEERLKSIFLGVRKRVQFLVAEQTLTRHAQRLAAAVAAQQIVDHRITELRPWWRLVAPEHGTRAKPHPVKAIEVVAIDVDVYDRDRTGGGVHSARQGIARRVPRYATIELPDKFSIHRNVQLWKRRFDTTNMEMEDTLVNEMDTQDGPSTKAEPFAVLDPTLGKLDVDFDPDKVPMLTLQLDIEKDSTGFCQSVCLEALSSGTTHDEKVVVALQHSLFCASLFESIRTEMANYKVAWLSTAMEINYLPPPNVMAGGSGIGGRGAIAVIHCHEGEVKVQLDSEYSLTIKLVEASDDEQKQVETNENISSGSQSSAQLHILCRTLLLHAQNVYHKYCIGGSVKKKVKVETAQGHVLKSNDDRIISPRILQATVGLGAKLILERNIRLSLKRMKFWLQRQNTDAAMTVDWLSLSLFDVHSHFVVTCLGLTIDVSLDRDTISVSRFGHNGKYRRVEFHSHREFELFLKMDLQTRVKRSNGQHCE